MKDTANLPFINSTILKGAETENRSFGTLEYLFKFLDAYDFASEGAEDQENNRSLINASVLGKVFEKINGYKDGSIYTPGFITMYMCRQAIRLAVVQKFKDKYELDISEFDELQKLTGNYKSADKIMEYNALVNSLHLCDPAVGSGHFLVSSLNEIIAIKRELGFLRTRRRSISKYEITIENDELIFTEEKRYFRVSNKRTANRRQRSAKIAENAVSRKADVDRKLSVRRGHQPEFGQDLPSAVVDRTFEKRLLQRKREFCRTGNFAEH